MNQIHSAIPETHLETTFQKKNLIWTLSVYCCVVGDLSRAWML